MTSTAFDINYGSYVPGVFATPDAQKADELYLRIQLNLRQAGSSSSAARKARFNVMTHFKSLSASKGWTALPASPEQTSRMLDKHAALRATFQSLIDAFEHYLLRIVDDAEALAALMPTLREDCRLELSNPNLAFVRKCNTVACARLLKGLTGRLTNMFNSCSVQTVNTEATTDLVGDTGDRELVEDLARGGQDLQDRLHMIGKPRKHALFADLDVPFVRDASEAKAHVDVQDRLDALNSAMERSQACLENFLRCKSGFFGSSVNMRWLDAGSADERRFILDCYDGTTIDFQSSRWALQAANKELSLAIEQMAGALRASKHHMSRRGHFVSVLCNNIVSAQACAHKATALLDRCQRKLAETPNENGGTDSRRVVIEAFESLPADFKLPPRYLVRMG